MSEPVGRRARGNLPAEVTSFIGRGAEVIKVQRLLGTSRLVTLTGVGGVGKTRLAIRAAHGLKHNFADGVWLVELSWLQDSCVLGHTVAEALRVKDQTTRPQTEVIMEYLAGKQLLLVLDGAEHMIAACAALASALLRAAPKLVILVTSRQQLDVPGQLVMMVSPLPIPDPGQAGSGSVALFAERAAAVVPQFALTADNQPDVERLCRRLDGIPLAIELAAVQLRALPVKQIVDRLEDRFRLLTGGQQAALPRHQTMRTAIGWSHELCDPAGRLLWARLSVFSGDFTLDGAEEICSDGQLPAGQIMETLSGLVSKSIVAREETRTGVRFRMLDTVREYGAEWLLQLDDDEAGRLRQRHRDYYLPLAERGERDWFSSHQEETFNTTEAELGNLRAVLDFSLSTPGQVAAGLHLAATLWFYWVGCGHLGEGRQWLDRALGLELEPTKARAKALWVNGYIADLQGDYSSAVRMLEECKAQAGSAGDTTALAYAIHRIGCAALLQDEHARAELLFSDALALYREAGELNSNVIMCQVELAMAIAFQGDLRRAAELCGEVRQTCEEHGELWAYSYALYVLSQAERLSGDGQQATALAAESLRINHTFHDLLGVVNPMELLALFAAEQGESERAAVLQGGASMIWPSVGLQLFGSAYFNAPHLECEALARKELGDDAYERAFQRGTALSLNEAVRYALSDPLTGDLG